MRPAIFDAHWCPTRLRSKNGCSFSRKDIPIKVSAFPMGDVRLLPNSVYYEAQEWNRGYMSRLAADRCSTRSGRMLVCQSALPSL